MHEPNTANILKVADALAQGAMPLDGAPAVLKTWLGDKLISPPARIAGLAAMMANGEDPDAHPIIQDRQSGHDISTAAQRWLSLDDTNALALFSPQRLQDKIRARDIDTAWAIRCLRRLAKTGRTEWLETKLAASDR